MPGTFYQYDQKGNVATAASDEDLDGLFETQWRFRNGNVLWQSSDTNADGFHDITLEYQHGILKNVTYMNAETHEPQKIQTYGPFGLISATIDTNGDGVLDTQIHYDAIEEVESTQKLQ